MSVRLHILDATPKSGKTICLTCKRSTIVKGQNCEEVVLCAGPFSGNGSYGTVPFRVSSCGSYHPMNTPWLHEMKDIAWNIEARKRGPAGFTPPEGEDVMEVVIKKPREKYDPIDNVPS